jgi:transposase InsO family protein
MSTRIHPQARTTPKIRQEIKDSGLSDREAAKVFNITRATAAKWLKRDDVQDTVCAGMGIEHRLAPPRHPQTNGMVERFNGRISELLQQTRFDSQARRRCTTTSSCTTITYRSELSGQKHRSRRSQNGNGRSPNYL